MTAGAKDCPFGAIFATTVTEHQPVETRMPARELNICQADGHWISARTLQRCPDLGEPLFSERQF